MGSLPNIGTTGPTGERRIKFPTQGNTFTVFIFFVTVVSNVEIYKRSLDILYRIIGSENILTIFKILPVVIGKIMSPTHEISVP